LLNRALVAAEDAWSIAFDAFNPSRLRTGSPRGKIMEEHTNGPDLAKGEPR
jgi:hypothetical protein